MVPTMKSLPEDTLEVESSHGSKPLHKPGVMSLGAGNMVPALTWGAHRVHSHSSWESTWGCTTATCLHSPASSPLTPPALPSPVPPSPLTPPSVPFPALGTLLTPPGTPLLALGAPLSPPGVPPAPRGSFSVPALLKTQVETLAPVLMMYSTSRLASSPALPWPWRPTTLSTCVRWAKPLPKICMNSATSAWWKYCSRNCGTQRDRLSSLE